jgi:hypothetical protein
MPISCKAQTPRQDEKGLQKVSITLDWTPNTIIQVFMLLKNWLFKEQSLEVDILQPGQNITIKL